MATRTSVEAAAAASSAVLRGIAAASPDAVIVTDDRGHCTSWNPAATELFGWQECHMIGQPLTRLVTADDQVVLAAVLADAAEHRVRWPEATWVSAHGAERSVDVTVGPIRADDGTLTGLAVLASDVTDQRTAEAALREANDALMARAGDLGDVNERLGAFAATLSHDLLQPVAALDGFLMLIDRFAPELDPEHRDWLDRAIRSKDRIAEAIGALHRNVTSGEVPLEPVAVAEVVADLVAELPEEIVVRVGALPIVLGNRGLLAQVLANILQNSVRYRADHRLLEIDVEAHDEGSSWELAITDTGQGIRDDELESVFERGVRGQASVGTDGTGTGLATVRALVQRMGGHAWVEAHDGGARVCLRLRADVPR